MPVTSPDPASSDASSVAKAKSKAEVDEFKGALGAAQAAVTAAWGDVKSLVSAGKECNLVVLTAAIDDLTDAVGDVTAHGSRFAAVSDDEAKVLRDAHSALTQAYSDLRTLVEFGGSADQSSLPTVVANMDAAVSGASSAPKS